MGMGTQPKRTEMGRPCGDGDRKGALVPTQLSNACIREIEASIDVDICMDVYVKSVDMDMDIDDRYHVHGYVKIIHNNARSNSVGTVPCTEADNRR